MFEFQVVYGEFALFFHDQYGGEVIAVLLKPGIFDAKKVEVIFYADTFVVTFYCLFLNIFRF